MVSKKHFLKPFFLFLSFFIPFILFLNVLLQQFYVTGAPYFDAGLEAHLLSTSLSFRKAPVFPHDPSLSYFSTHFSPFLIITSWIFKSINSGFYPYSLSSSAYFCGFMALLASALPFSMAWILLQTTQKLSMAFWGCLLSLFAGPLLSCISYPHWEIGIIAALAFYFIFSFHHQPFWSGLSLCLGLIMREDAGLHYFGLFLMMAYFLKRAHQPYGHYLQKAFLCSTYSLFALSIQHFFYPGDNALLRIYLGTPLFSHLNGSFFIDRLGWMLLRARTVLFPFFAAFFFAWKTKDPFLAIGPLCVLPWIFLSFVAVNPTAGTLQLYYSFPVLIAFFWPIFLSSLQKKLPFLTPHTFQKTLSVLCIGFFLTLTDKAHRLTWAHMLDFRWLKNTSFVEPTHTALLKLSFLQKKRKS